MARFVGNLQIVMDNTFVSTQLSLSLMRSFVQTLFFGLVLLLVPLSSTAQPTIGANQGNPNGSDIIPSTEDTLKAGIFDYGKMWTFENPPYQYFEEAYDFNPDSTWFRQAMRSALRIPGCSAAFVSPNGLVATNHHCARGSVVKVSQPGEDLLDNGFFAGTLEEERLVEGFYADQLIAIRDVTDEIHAATSSTTSVDERKQIREQLIQSIQERIKNEFDTNEDSVVVEVISLYHGGRYSAYVFHRHTQIKLVAAPELQLGYFGGDSDNFTYPRYALDFALFRVYDQKGVPLRTDDYFPMSDDGIQKGDLVFVIGNPGSTSRLETVSQLEYRRDVQVPSMLDFLNSRVSVLQNYISNHPEESDAQRNLLFSLLNSQKAYIGRMDALRDTIIMARRRDAESNFQNALLQHEDLKGPFGNLLETMASLQARKTALASNYHAFWTLFNSRFSSALLRRALLAHLYLQASQRGANENDLSNLRSSLLSIADHPQEIEQPYLESQLRAVQEYLLDDHASLREIFGHRTPGEIAGTLLANSRLSDSTSTRQFLNSATPGIDDPALKIAEQLLPLYQEFQNAFSSLERDEQEIAGEIGRARFAVYGTKIPPDATFSPRITDGIVKGYEYNGTQAAPHTTFYGLYNHYYSYGPGTEWDLPQRWLTPPATFDRSTPLNFISTSDTIGGNSGSPVINRDLEFVGLNFDRNIEGLARDFIYLPERGRNIMVDARAIREALDDIYDSDRIAIELTTGRLVETEQEADSF